MGLSSHWHEETAHGRQELPAETQPTAAKIEAQSQEAETESHGNPVSLVPHHGFFRLVGVGASRPLDYSVAHCGAVERAVSGE